MNFTAIIGFPAALGLVLGLVGCDTVSLACHVPKASHSHESDINSSPAPIVNPPREATSQFPTAFNQQRLEPLHSSSRRVYVSDIIDARGKRPVDPTISGATVPAGDMSRQLRSTLRESLKDNGVDFGFVNTPIIRGRLIDWYGVTNIEAFQDSVDAKAVLELTLFGPDDKSVYRAVYTGEATRYNSLFTSSRVKRSLEVALEEAIDEAASDPKLLEHIEKYSS